jgi:hypothetical protein
MQERDVNDAVETLEQQVCRILQDNKKGTGVQGHHDAPSHLRMQRR